MEKGKMSKKTPFELREEANRIELRESEEKFQKKLKIKKDFEKKIGIEVYTSDDYCGLDIGDLQFYYGYEETYCKKHPKINDCEDRYDCEKREWCFTVTKNGKELMRIPTSKLHPEEGEEPFWYLVAGIGHYLKSEKK